MRRLVIGDVPQDVRDVARILQQGLAPTAIPSVLGLSVTARYRAGGLGEVGGDWYDVLDLPDSGVAIVIGDVAGHGVTAATTMAHLRHALRAYVLEDDSPASVLGRLNRLTHWILPGEIATAIVAVVDPSSEQITVASAGHLPPLLVADDTAGYMELVSGPALGVSSDPGYSEWTEPLDGAGILLFTDGMIERRGESIDAGLARLADASAAKPWGTDLLDELIKEVADPAGADDLAIVAICRAAG